MFIEGVTDKVLVRARDLAFYNDMKHRAAGMVQPPDDYSMRKFINGLLLSLAEGVVKSRGISTEHSPMDDPGRGSEDGECAGDDQQPLSNSANEEFL